ncbi:hypothetical protein ACHAWX_005970 [Stephanocyclus meneghinianus]
MTVSSSKRRAATATKNIKKSKTPRPSKWPQCDLFPLFAQEKVSKKKQKRTAKVSESPRNEKRPRRRLFFEGQKSILESLNDETTTVV